MGLEPTDLLHAMQALYQLSYTPGGQSRYQCATPIPAPSTAERAFVPRVARWARNSPGGAKSGR